MKRYTIIVFTFLICLQTSAQTANQIIDKNIQATGGLTQWKLLNTVLLEGRVILGEKEHYPIKIYQQRPNLIKTLIVVNKKETILEGYDGKKGYAMNYAANKLQEYKDYIAESFDTDFIDFQSKGFVANLLGKEKVGSTECYKIELIKNVNKTIYYFDTKSFMLLKEIKKDETLLYSNYRKVQNLMMPFKIEASTVEKKGDYTMILNTIETNKNFPEGTFKF